MITANIMEDLVFQEGPNKQPLVKREGYTVIRISIGNGTVIPPHMANHSAFFLVLKGRVIFTAGEKEVKLEENQYIAMEADQLRGMHALEDSVVLGIRD
jgi:quercetin dioxygenase-like cupin family protein